MSHMFACYLHRLHHLTALLSKNRANAAAETLEACAKLKSLSMSPTMSPNPLQGSITHCMSVSLSRYRGRERARERERVSSKISKSVDRV